MGRTGSIDNKSIKEIAELNKELIKLNKNTSKQNSIMIKLTRFIAIFTVIMVIMALI